MDIAALSTAMSMEKLHVNVGYAMMSKVMGRREYRHTGLRLYRDSFLHRDIQTAEGRSEDRKARSGPVFLVRNL